MSNWKFIILFLALIGVFVSFGQDLPKKALKRINPYWDLKSNPAKDIKITQFKVEEINLAERTLTIPDFTVYVPEKAEIVQVKTFNVREESEDERIEGEVSLARRRDEKMTKKRKAKRKKRAGKRRRGQDRPRCGLCGSTTNLTKTECCGQWICDDEGRYVPFSYARNSCYRNHRRYTLCGYHHAEGHPGHWKDCLQCKEDITPDRVDRVLFNLAPVLVVVPALLGFAFLPFGPGLAIVDHRHSFLFFIAFASLTLLGIFAAGWSSNNKYALLSALRMVALVVSYEIPLLLSLLVPALLAGSFRLDGHRLQGSDLLFPSHRASLRALLPIPRMERGRGP